jgi:methylenetetrahydrofolate--tRNA-(uracil-5-)-methyltransferase
VTGVQTCALPICLLAPDLSLRAEPRLFFAGQITGVEGYVESTACGYLTALAVHARRTGTPFAPPPATTALGALYRHVTGEAHLPGAPYQPTNVVYALFPPITGRLNKAQKRQAYAARSRADFDAWAPTAPHPVKAAPIVPVAQPDAVAPAPLAG